MKKANLGGAVLCVAHVCAPMYVDAAPATLDAKVEALLKRMTVQEKVGQLNQYSGESQATGPVTFKGDQEKSIREGHVGSLLNVIGANSTRQYQEVAMQSRLKIPLLFGMDVIHGYKTTFPIPLAEAASWDLTAIEHGARVAAIEAAASGIHWTFAPMVDIARDPRWGRVMEGAGEDTYLASKIAYARVKGFQGKQLGDLDSVMATAKHFAAYGAAVGGRDYNAVDMSERMLWETYLPPFKAALDAGAATFMNSFNDLNGIPATGSAYLQRDILKGKWGFRGFVVSDWGSIGEMVAHGYVKDKSAAAQSAIKAGSDMDMESNAYRDHLPALVAGKEVTGEVLDDAVQRVLRKKFELGLFDDPFRFSNTEREKALVGHAAHRKAAREMAAKSIVLLKNDHKLLPLSRDVKTIAFIGPMVKAVKDNHGFWSVNLPDVDYSKFIVTQWDGLKNHLRKETTLLYAKGSEIEGDDRSGFAEAVRVARQADVVVVSVGERWDMSGEAKSRSSLRLPGVQEELIQALQATGKPVVVLINAGRPLVFNWIADNVPAILYTWWLGSEAGNAIADVLLGDYNPGAKLPMSFPRSEGQIPIYYNKFNTGRPAADDKAGGYVSGYIDLQGSPRYPFGFGMSYTDFAFSDLRLDKTSMRINETITVSLTLKNTGKVAGEEVVQLYLHDKVASVVRPVLELKDFQKIRLEAGESRRVTFAVDREKLSFFNAHLKWDAEPGAFELMVGASAADIRLRANFELLKEETHSMLRAQGTQWVRSDGRPIALKGANLGNWLLPEFWMMGYPDNAAVNDQCTLQAVLDQRFGFQERERLLKLYRDNWITDRDWDLIPQFGLNMVRLPFIWSALEDEKNPLHLRPDAWHYLDNAIAQAKARGLYVILDLHGAVGSQGKEHHSGCANQNLYWTTPEYQQRTDWLWRQIAARYRDNPVVAGYGLLNEPWGSTDVQLAEVSRKLYASIREIDTRHIIILPDHPKGIAAYGKPAEHGMHNVVFETHPYPGHFGWGKPGADVHKNWLQCVPAGGGLCAWKDRMAALDTPLFMGEFQPWADLDAELGGQITRASFDAYASQSWAAAVWSFKVVSFKGGKLQSNWGLVMNDEAHPLPELDFERASLHDIEARFKSFGSVPYRTRTEVMKWMKSDAAPHL
jgi:beta-glucosidase